MDLHLVGIFCVPPQKRKKHEIEKRSAVQMHVKKKQHEQILSCRTSMAVILMFTLPRFKRSRHKELWPPEAALVSHPASFDDERPWTLSFWPTSGAFAAAQHPESPQACHFWEPHFEQPVICEKKPPLSERAGRSLEVLGALLSLRPHLRAEKP